MRTVSILHIHHDDFPEVGAYQILFIRDGHTVRGAIRNVWDGARDICTMAVEWAEHGTLPTN